MLDGYIRELSAKNPTVIEEVLALLEREIDQLAASLGGDELAEMAAREPRKVIGILGELARTGTVEGLCAYIDGHPAGACLWVVPGEGDPKGEEEGGRPRLLLLLVAEEHQHRGLARWLLSEASFARAPSVSASSRGRRPGSAPSGGRSGRAPR